VTTKERWTVYPLLLLAIGLALRGELTSDVDRSGQTISAETVVCRELAVIGEPGEADQPAPIIVHAGRVRGGAGGRIEIRDGTGADAVAIGTSSAGREGGVEFFDAGGQLLGKLGPKASSSATPPVPAEN
jgi:hypothetical protein